MRHLLAILVFAVSGAAQSAPAAPSREAVDRGTLSLAWDAHESGLLEEALGYLRGIPGDSPVGADALWLRAECLADLARYAEAADLLEGPGGAAVADRDGLLLDVYWDWAWEATGREDYADALRVLDRGQRALPGEGALPALAETTRFRGALAAVAARGDAGELATGEVVAIRPEGSPPRGGGWSRAYPWRPDLPWVSEVTLEDWMPRLAQRLDREGRVLWVRVERRALERRLAAAAAREGLTARGSEGEVRLAEGNEAVVLSLAEWEYRGAAEGLGAAGAAAFALLRARERLEDRRDLFRWVDEHRRELELERREGARLLRHPGTGRTFLLDAEGWSEVFRAPGDEWQEFWLDLQQELARPNRPYRCFCGREVFLREVLLEDPGEALVLEKDRGSAAVAVALCPLHHQYVTTELARGWRVGLPELRDRIRRDAEEHPWDVSFVRGKASGSSYLVLEGEGVSALGRNPELLLGALEGVDGVAARGTTVRVLAPTPSTLVVVGEGTPEATADAAATRAVLGAEPRSGRVERLNFRAEVRLPRQGRGAFQMTHTE